MLTAIMAVLVGALALAVSVYTARLQQLQVRAEVWPHLGWVFVSDRQALQLVNKGVGPAHLHWVTIAAGETTLQRWEQLFDALSLSQAELGGVAVSSLEAQVVGAGEVVTALQFDRQADWVAFQKARSRLRITLCYCSVLGECRVRGDEAGGWGAQEWIDACPAPPRVPFFG